MFEHGRKNTIGTMKLICLDGFMYFLRMLTTEFVKIWYCVYAK